MAINTNNAHSYGDITQRILTAPLGTTIPTSPLPTAFGAGWLDLGWMDDAGLTETDTKQETKKYGWQGGALVRVLRSQAEHSFAFNCLEENAITYGLLRPNSTIVTSGGSAEVQTVTITGTGTAGTWTLTLPGVATASGLAFNITTSALATALNSAFGMTGITVTGSAGTSYVVTFPVSAGNVVQLTATQAITGATGIAVVTTTPGVNGVNTTDVLPFVGRNLRMFGIDLVDGGVHRRFVAQNGEVTGNGDVIYNADNLTVLQYTLECYIDTNGAFFRDINDNPALASGLYT